ncbi:MAG: hypothetical protein ACJAUV_001225 [Flavobacteriales bacterium]|jgi:hypothetical protein
MYHKIFFFAISLLCILSCDKVTDPYQEKADITASRKIMIEEFTGHTCGNCPTGSAVLSELTELFGDNLVAVSVHSGGFAVPICENDKYCAEFRTQTGETLLNEFQINQYPIATINRTLFNGIRTQPSGSWGSLANELLSLPAEIKIDIEANIDTNTRNLSVIVNTTILQAVTGDFNISVGLVEDSIVGYQKYYKDVLGYTEETDVPDYMHRHVFRGNLNGIWGDAINLTEPIGNTVVYTAPVSVIKSAHKLKDLYVIAYIHNNETKEIIQVEEVHLLH